MDPACAENGKNQGPFLSGLRLLETPQQLPRVHRPLGGLLVLEIRKHIAPRGKMLLDPLRHRRALVRRIGRLAKTVIHKTSGDYLWRCHLLSLSHAQRSTALA